MHWYTAHLKHGTLQPQEGLLQQPQDKQHEVCVRIKQRVTLATAAILGPCWTKNLKLQQSNGNLARKTPTAQPELLEPPSHLHHPFIVQAVPQP